MPELLTAVFSPIPDISMPTEMLFTTPLFIPQDISSVIPSAYDAPRSLFNLIPELKGDLYTDVLHDLSPPTNILPDTSFLLRATPTYEDQVSELLMNDALVSTITFLRRLELIYVIVDHSL